MAKDFNYPADHQVGIEVPLDGSDCDKCEYLKDRDKRICGESHFIAAECKTPPKPAGSDQIPLPVNRYCCDFFEPKAAPKSLGQRMSAQGAPRGSS